MTTTGRAVAAIDCGTNGTRILISDAATGTARYRQTIITRLGQDVDRTGRLAPEAIDRVATALTGYKALIDEHHITAGALRVVATSAARDAANTDGFFDAAERILGTRPELLPAEEEGRLSFRGATRDLDPDAGPYLVVDIGGGSTEFVTAHPTAGAPSVVSVDVGCVRLTERFLHGDPPDAGELSDALSIVRSHLDDVVRIVPATLDAARLVGLSGTVTAMAAIELGLAEPDADKLHHFVLTRAAAEDVFRTMATEPKNRRRHNPGLEPDRVDVIVGGALILVAVLRHFDFDDCLVSVSDILDGLVHELRA
jgi:exopolyphosphatase / guanosine-5'-triphosphate,3'-diphosphate pyrophosphatase